MNGVFCSLKSLFLCKRFAVGTLVHGRVHFVSTDGNAIQRTVVFGIAMMFTLLYGAFDRMICLIHKKMPPCFLIVSFSKRTFFSLLLLAFSNENILSYEKNLWKQQKCYNRNQKLLVWVFRNEKKQQTD